MDNRRNLRTAHRGRAVYFGRCVHGSQWRYCPRPRTPSRAGWWRHCIVGHFVLSTQPPILPPRQAQSVENFANKMKKSVRMTAKPSVQTDFLLHQKNN